MPKPKLYPLTPLQIETAVAELVLTGRHLDGKRAASPKPAYFRHFRFAGCAESGGTSSSEVASRDARFSMRCDVHGTTFDTTTRILFNTSTELTGTTCRYCERDAGVGMNFVTLAEIAHQIAASEDFDWTLDFETLPPDTRADDQILSSSQLLPLICKRTKWNSSERCETRTEHRVSNVLTALNRRKRHLLCQGDCDSKSKGKSSRVSRDELERRISQARGGAWVLSKSVAYRRLSDEQWFTHTLCGNEVKRVPWQILGFVDEGAGGDDCPYCQGSSVLGCIAKSVLHFQRWVQLVTNRVVSYVGSSFPETNEAFLDFLCKCGNVFQQKLGSLTRCEHYGCDQCRHASLKAQRAWILDEAKAMVERRGYRLLDNPGSYTEPARLSTASGEPAPFATILELMGSMPIHADGFGQSTHLSSSRCDSGLLERRRYPVNDRVFKTLTPESCYWAGLLAADATISDKAEIVLELKAGDELVLQALARFVSFDGACHYRTVRNVDGRGIYCSLRFRSRQICEDLEKHFGIGPRKTHNLPQPAISDPALVKAYMEGLFEGDGHVRRTRRGLVVHFVSAAKDGFLWFLEQANAITATSAKPRVVRSGHSQIFNVTYQNAAARKLLKALSDAYPGYMSRKWQT